jgi:hypothetical protein
MFKGETVEKEEDKPWLQKCFDVTGPSGEDLIGSARMYKSNFACNARKTDGGQCCADASGKFFSL